MMAKIVVIYISYFALLKENIISNLISSRFLFKYKNSLDFSMRIGDIFSHVVVLRLKPVWNFIYEKSCLVKKLYYSKRILRPIKLYWFIEVFGFIDVLLNRLHSKTVTICNLSRYEFVGGK